MRCKGNGEKCLKRGGDGVIKESFQKHLEIGDGELCSDHRSFSIRKMKTFAKKLV